MSEYTHKLVEGGNGGEKFERIFYKIFLTFTITIPLFFEMFHIFYYYYCYLCDGRKHDQQQSRAM